MWIRRSMRFITKAQTDARLRTLLYVLYYLIIIGGLLLLYGRGNYTLSPFVYQGF